MARNLIKFVSILSFLSIGQPLYCQTGSLTPRYDTSKGAPDKKNVNNRVLLRGGIKHLKKLPPVNKKYWVGKVFEDFPSMELETNHVWYQVPSWYAGQWHREHQTQIGQRGFTLYRKFESFMVRPFMGETIVSRIDYSIGDQVDGKGTIWAILR